VILGVLGSDTSTRIVRGGCAEERVDAREPFELCGG